MDRGLFGDPGRSGPPGNWLPMKSPEGESPVRDLGSGSSSNIIVAVIDNCIAECLLQRMQKEVVLARSRYDWGTIKVAAGRVWKRR